MILKDDTVLLRDFKREDIAKRIEWETEKTEWQLWDGPWEYEGLTEEQKKEELQNSLGREPTVEEIAAAMQQPKEDVVLAMEAIMEPSSLYDPAYSDGRENICLIDQVQDKTSESDWLDEMLLRQAMEALSAREKKILSLRFFAGKTQVEVSQAVGISQAQVSRIEKGALQRIKTQM